MKNILIAEDEPRLATWLAKKLQANSFITSIANDGYQVIQMIGSQLFDLLLLDLGLPGKNGVEVLKELRAQGKQLPIIILTARDNVKNQLAGLERGADDYVTKPFNFEELLARIHLRLQEHQFPETKPETVLQLENLVIDLASRTVKVGESAVQLSHQELILLDTLMRHPNQVLSREELLNYVWGHNYDPNSKIVDVYVEYLRQKLGSHIIETVRGVGYRLRTP
jgi:DNA-binding response OmpR family regulator